MSYNTKSINFKENEHKSTEFLKVNPNGKIPALIDGEYTIWESMGINFYIADKYKPQLLGNDPMQRGLVHQWSFWAIADLQAPIIEVFIQLVFVPEEKRDASVIEKAMSKLPALLATLEQELQGRNYLLGDDFSLADLNVASVVSICDKINFSLEQYKNVSQWRNRISERSAFKKYMELRK